MTAAVVAAVGTPPQREPGSTGPWELGADMGEVAGQGHREETAAWEWLKEAGPGQRQAAGETHLYLCIED